MGQTKEIICIVGGTDFLASVQNFALRRDGHTIHDGGRDLPAARQSIEQMIETGTTVVLVNSMGYKEEGRRKEAAFAAEVRQRAPEVIIVSFSLFTKKEVTYGDFHFQRIGGEADWERLPKAIASIREKPLPPRTGKGT